MSNPYTISKEPRIFIACPGKHIPLFLLSLERSPCQSCCFLIVPKVGARAGNTSPFWSLRRRGPQGTCPPPFVLTLEAVRKKQKVVLHWEPLSQLRVGSLLFSQLVPDNSVFLFAVPSQASQNMSCADGLKFHILFLLCRTILPAKEISTACCKLNQIILLVKNYCMC